MARVKINILEISELKWLRMDGILLDDHYVYDYEQESLEELE